VRAFAVSQSNRRPIRCATFAVAAAVMILVFAADAQAVILYRSAIRNKSAPTGTEANSGWQWEGNWAGGFVGTPIAPHYFMSASHLGGSVGGAIYFHGKNYTTTAAYDDPSTDLKIYKINGTFPTYAPLYSLSSEVGKTAVVYGRGTGRGNAVVKNGVTKGWLWATQDKVMSWGDNKVSSTLDGGSGYGQLLKFNFDRNNRTSNEGALSTGDSGGGVFISDNGKWKLAGINYLVDGPFSLTSGGSQFQASIFDKGGLYINGNQPITDTAADVPGAWYATRISSRQSWIKSIIGTVPAAVMTSPGDLAVTSAVPEPASLGLIAAGATLLLRRRR
jgi:hypothetical protein